jgi:hypothetical protein
VAAQPQVMSQTMIEGMNVEWMQHNVTFTAYLPKTECPKRWCIADKAQFLLMLVSISYVFFNDKYELQASTIQHSTGCHVVSRFTEGLKQKQEVF